VSPLRSPLLLLIMVEARITGRLTIPTHTGMVVGAGAVLTGATGTAAGVGAEAGAGVEVGAVAGMGVGTAAGTDNLMLSLQV
jgi:hypothetical protein